MVKKFFAFLLVFILLANLLIFGLGKITPLPFWIVIGAVGIVAYVWYPKVKK